ncbi:hypothetical protein CBOM_06514 [Ceraceosorus bombacis]|uniref:Uncharacterized protein n=1 Tax=Ceraceosorus bombacis TaxID=401625 RepID=A0A0N7LAH2_9BASI|nr:hypothetical protein CBOM_06514 [Ceraceosorus bombacis]
MPSGCCLVNSGRAPEVANLGSASVLGLEGERRAKKAAEALGNTSRTIKGHSRLFTQPRALIAL